MKTSSPAAFVNQLVVYTLVMIGFSGSIGLGAVWLRHQISVTANATKVAEQRIVEIERRLTETTAAIESERDPQTLLRRNEEWRLGLLPPAQVQVVHVNEDAALRLASKRNRGLFGDRPAAVFLPVNVQP